MTSPINRMILAWDYGTTDRWWENTQALVVEGTPDEIRERIGKLPAMVDLRRRYFLFRAEKRERVTKLPAGRWRARYIGKWIERPSNPGLREALGQGYAPGPR